MFYNFKTIHLIQWKMLTLAPERRTANFCLSYDVASESEIRPCNKIVTNSGLQISGKRYDVHNNIAYIMTQL